MKTNTILGLLLCSSTFFGCATKTDRSHDTDPPVTERPGEADDDDGDIDEHDEPKPKTFASCSAPLESLSCDSLEPAPTKSSDISAFVKDSAIPIRCGEDDNARWDVQPLVDLYGDNKMFMVGEVHGTNEIGIVSSLLLEQLATNKKVNVVGFELSMDYQNSLQRYIDTGNDEAGEYIVEELAPNMFASILTRTARELVKKGIPIRIAPVDFPTTTQTPIAAIKQIAAKLTTQKSTVLDDLPTWTGTTASSADEAAAGAYFDKIMASEDAICAELSDADCDRLDAMTHALWVVTTMGSSLGEDLWFQRREVVIYYNMRMAMPEASDRMFLHMGAFHTNKSDTSAGSRMTHEYALTKGKVFSVAPAFGDGSVIEYSGEQDVPADPPTLIKALTNNPANPLFVSTTRPSKTCEENPFGLEYLDVSSGTRAETYDGYIHYGKLTPETKPNQTKYDRDIAIATSGKKKATSELAAGALAHLGRVQAKERAALRALLH